MTPSHVARSCRPAISNWPLLASKRQIAPLHEKVSVTVQSRALVPSYLFRAKVLAWECSLCRKLFAVRVDEAERPSATTPPAHIQYDFRTHNCVCALFERAAKRKGRDVKYFFQATR